MRGTERARQTLHAALRPPVHIRGGRKGTDGRTDCRIAFKSPLKFTLSILYRNVSQNDDIIRDGNHDSNVGSSAAVREQQAVQGDGGRVPRGHLSLRRLHRLPGVRALPRALRRREETREDLRDVGEETEFAEEPF